jgi:hypothetical protein
MSEQSIEVRPEQVHRIAAMVAVPSHIEHFTEAARATRVDPSVWGDQQELVAAANRWQLAFQNVVPTFTTGLTSTRDVLDEAASAYRAHDALTGRQYGDLRRQLDHRSGPWRQ